jgi:hypothetical protein
MKYWFIFLVFFFSEVSAQVNCLTISSSDQYFSASGQGETEAEAKTSAAASLVSQISSYVTTRTDMMMSMENQVAQQTLVNLSTSRSQLRLDGLKYEVCNSSRKTVKTITVLAYISKEDLEKSTALVAGEVESYMSFIGTKKALDIDFTSDAYQAYLTTFFSPYPIPYQEGNDRIDNLKTHLERQIRDYFNKVEVICTDVEVDPLYPQDHLILTLNLTNSKDLNLRYDLEIPSINAKAQIDNLTGKVAVILQPISRNEVLKGRLDLKSSMIPGNLEEISKLVLISREIEFSVDFSSIIQIDFDVRDEGEYFKLVPKLKNISVKNIEWFSKGQLLSSEQAPRILKSEFGADILLKINKQENLSAKKNTGNLNRNNPIIRESITPNSLEPDAKIYPAEISRPAKTGDAESNFSKIQPEKLRDFKSLQLYLEELKSSGKAVYGKKSDFIYPDKCWVVLVNPDSRVIEHVLAPISEGKKDINKGIIYQDFESQLKGLVAIWVEFY